MPALVEDRIHTVCERLNDALSRKPWLFAFIMLGIYGAGHADYEPFALFVAHPLSLTLPPSLDSLYSSPLNLLVGAGFATVTGPAIAFALTIAVSLLAISAAWRLYMARFEGGQMARNSATFVVLSTPILLVLPAWLGKGDAFLLAGYLLLLASRGRGVMALVAGFVMLTAHREMGMIMMVGHCFLRGTLPRWAIAGAGIGVLAIAVYHYGLLPHAPDSRTNLVLSIGSSVLRRNASQPIMHLALGLSWFWIFAYQRIRDRDAWRTLAYIALIYGAAFMIIDFTRVLVILAAPVVLLTAERIAADPRRRAMPLSFPFPLLFLVQAQIIECNHLVDAVWGQQLLR